MMEKHSAGEISGGIFLIGLALLFMTGYWWPGILFVIGAANIARGMAQGSAWYNVSGGIGVIGLGLVFMVGFRFELLLIIMGIGMLAGVGNFWCNDNTRSPERKSKRKNEDMYYEV